jgi:hypothetical protein
MLSQSAEGFRLYVEPGTAGDGYVEPEWRIDHPFLPTWEGGTGDWHYVGVKLTRELERVYAFQYQSYEDQWIMRAEAQAMGREVL